MTFLASPYSSSDPAIRKARYVAACKAAARLIADGEIVYAAIPASHGIAVHGGAGTDAPAWERQNRHFFELSDKVVVLMLDGWFTSLGVQQEIGWAKELGKQTVFMQEI